ncbi:unnamed protein product [Closterium sp. NIES-53]
MRVAQPSPGAAATRAATHPAIVQLRAVFEDDAGVHLVMDLCDSGDLYDEVVRRGRLPEKESALLFRQIASALAFCHSRGVMHRDMKPENILLHKQGDASNRLTVKLADFGLAIPLSAGETTRGISGSTFYMAPEVLSGEYGHSADVWSLGVLLFTMLSGAVPFFGDDNSESTEAVLNGRLDFSSPEWATISVEAKGLIRCMLHRDPQRRPTASKVLSHPWVLLNVFGGRIVRRTVARPLENAVNTPENKRNVDAQCPQQQHFRPQPLRQPAAAVLGNSLCLEQGQRTAQDACQGHLHGLSLSISSNLAKTQSLPRFTAPTTLLADIIKHNIASIAPVNNVYIREGNKTANTPGAQNSGSLPGATARRAKRPAEEAREDLATGVKFLFGPTSSAPSEELLAAPAASKQPRDMAKKTAADAAVIIASAGQAGPSGARDMEHAPAAPSAPSAPSAPADASPLALTTAQVQALLAMLQQQAPVTVGTSNNDEVTASAKNDKKEENVVAPRPPKAARVEKNPAPAPAEEDSDESEDAAGEAPRNRNPIFSNAPRSTLPSLAPSTTTTTFNRKGVRDQAEVFSAIQAHLRLMELQLQQGDAEGALANVTQIETLINKRFEVLLVADEAGFEAADRFQLYQSKSVLTSRSYKLAVADVAASKCARMSYNRTGRGNGLDNGEIGNKGAGQGSCQNRAFKGTCFRCGQPGHMANACPMGGRGGQGPTPVV